jgi:hypothetical protein
MNRLTAYNPSFGSFIALLEASGGEDVTVLL